VFWQPGPAPPAPAQTTVRTPTATVREPEQAWWESLDLIDEPATSTVTVAAVHDRDAEYDPAAVATRLARLAADDELLVVFGAEHGPRGHRRMLAGLRSRLPRHDVVAVAARPDLAWLLGRLLDAGSLPVVLTHACAMHDLTAELAGAVRADRVVRILHTAAGADLYPVWRRPDVRRPDLN
jgi:hypothetical protein